MKNYKINSLLVIGSLLLFSAGCSTPTSNEISSQVQQEQTKPTLKTAELKLPEIEQKAREEGAIVSLAMPDTWANFGDSWKEVTSKYGLKHTDTDMKSAEEIAKFEAEKNNPTSDIGDVGISYAPIAVQKGVTQPYKTSYWDEIPNWAKDEEGHWLVGYQGTMAVLINRELIKNPPKTWEDLLTGDYKIAMGDVTKSTQPQMAVLAAAMAHGGDEKNIQPGIDFFATLAKQGRLSLSDNSIANYEKGEVSIGFVWDFNALAYRDKIDPNRFEARVLEEGSVISGYSTIINKYAPHPNAAKIMREYMLSDAGQINLAKGYARPIRESVKIPDVIAEKMIPKEQYKNAKPILDQKAWEETIKALPQLWQEQVLIHIK